jgi:UDP-2-acetamido-2-deoxy-ribo-hexuluronate aminotransferase
MSLEIGPGDEVITTPFTWISTVEVIKLLGAEPVYCDIDPNTFNIDHNKIENVLSDKTKAILPVSLFGQCPNFDEINLIAQKYNLFVIEDAAQSFGAEYKNKKSCSLSDIGCTSFFPSKPLGCYGDGGAIFTDNEELYQKLKAIRVHGASSKNNFDLIGINGRLDTIQAAILLVKFDIYEKEIELRQNIANNYKTLVQDATNDQSSDLNLILPHIENHNKSVYAQYTLKTDKRDLVLDRLGNNNIPFAIYYKTLANEHPAYERKGLELNVSKKLTEEVFSIPMHPYLSFEDQQKIINTIYGVN